MTFKIPHFLIPFVVLFMNIFYFFYDLGVIILTIILFIMGMSVISGIINYLIFSYP